MTRKRASIKVGCCGFGMAQANYFATFPCVEINSTFYQLPRLETAQRWREQAPADFEFALKAWQVITHPASSPTYKRTRIDARDREHCGDFGFNPTIRWAWEETFQIATALRAALVLFQCPSSFRATKENVARLEKFFTRAKRGKFAMGWEPRGDWDSALVTALCRSLDLVHVTDPLKSTPAAMGKIRYYRLHGITGETKRYRHDDLVKLKELCNGRSATYCFFNNTAMAADARRFMQLL